MWILRLPGNRKSRRKMREGKMELAVRDFPFAMKSALRSRVETKPSALTERTVHVLLYTVALKLKLVL